MPRIVSRQRQVNRQAAAVEKSLPPPVGGWNARDAVTSMLRTEAIEMVNWFPRPSYVETRGGSEQHMFIPNESIRSLAIYRNAAGDETMLGFADTAVYNASFGGESGGTGVVAWTDGRVVYENFGDGTNTWLIAVNGTDKPLYYGNAGVVQVDGITSPAITGITTTDIAFVAVFKERLMFIRNDKLGFDYLPAAAAGGAASHFDLSSIASLGGYLMAMGSWSRDAGDGPDDYWVGITSEGEALVYQGTDPSSANTWALVGTYRIGKPLGRKCMLKFGADPIVLTDGGVFPLSSLLKSGDERQKFAISYKVQPAFSEAAVGTQAFHGWTAVSYTQEDALIVNVPIEERGKHVQFVMNTISKAWAKFEGWDAEDFAVFNDELYYCKGARIWKAWEGTSDERLSNGTAPQGKTIAYTVRQSFQDFGTAALKEPLLLLPIMELSKASSRTLTSDDNGTIEYAAGIDSDFTEVHPTPSTTVQSSTEGIWGNSYWGTATWGNTPVVRQWGGTASWPGRWLSATLRIVANATSGKWLGSVIRFKIGEGL